MTATSTSGARWAPPPWSAWAWRRRKPDRTVMVVTGDGEQLMGLGGLATIAIAAPANLVIVVLDNGHYGETGMQRSHTGFGLDLAVYREVRRLCRGPNCQRTRPNWKWLRARSGKSRIRDRVFMR